MPNAASVIPAMSNAPNGLGLVTPASSGAETIQASTACSPKMMARLFNSKFGWLRWRMAW